MRPQPGTAGVEEITLHAKKADHLPTTLQVVFKNRSVQGPVLRRKAAYSRDAVRNSEANETFGKLLDQCELEMLEVEPTSHLHILTQKVAAAANEAFAQIRAVPRQPWMSSITFSVVKEMKETSKEHRRIGR